ncbi:MAG TPA: hypothetical protein VK904_02655 [Miltoncostaeaceae bacterium]|nr:hypothetical protein [Miltoncostaeaceae bacterium]
MADPSLGTGMTGENVAVLAAWGIAGLIVAARGSLGAAGAPRLSEQTFTAP